MSVHLIESALMVLISMFSLHEIIFSILVGNMNYKSYKNAKKHARSIANEQSTWGRLTQIYIGSYTRKFSNAYRFYMLLKVLILGAFLIFPIALLYVEQVFGQEFALRLCKIKSIVDTIICAFVLSRFGWLDRRTKYERDCGRF